MKHIGAVITATIVLYTIYIRFVDGSAAVIPLDLISLPAVFSLFYISLYLYYLIEDYRESRHRRLNRKRMWI